MSDRSPAHTNLVNEILVSLSTAGALVINNKTGALYDRQGRLVSFGQPGSPDIIAIVPPNGRFLGVEVKTGQGRPSPVQKRWRAAVLERGGVYVVARCVEDAMLALQHIRSAGNAIIIPIADAHA